MRLKPIGSRWNRSLVRALRKPSRESGFVLGSTPAGQRKWVDCSLSAYERGNAIADHYDGSTIGTSSK